MHTLTISDPGAQAKHTAVKKIAPVVYKMSSYATGSPVLLTLIHPPMELARVQIVSSIAV